MADDVMANNSVTCAFCAESIRPDDRQVWRLAEGWERRGKAGGSDIAMRKPAVPASFACNACITRLRSGLDPAQETLL